MLSIQRLKELFHYDAETGIFTRLKTAGGMVTGSIAGSLNPMGYLRVSIDHERYLCHRLAWLYSYGSWPEHEIDHINGIRTDNRLCNLRDVPHCINQLNKLAPKNNTSGVKGVYWNKKDKRWHARCSIDGKKYHIGNFTDLNEARAVVVAARERMHGKHAVHEERKPENL